MNDKMNKLQTKKIQLNADNFETQLAVTELMSLIHAYTSAGKDGIPSAIYKMMELHIKELIDSKILNMNLARHQEVQLHSK